MKKKIISIIAITVLLMGVLVGCTTNDGMVLSKAIIKNMEIKSAETDTKIWLNVETEGMEVNEHQQNILDTINGSGIQFQTKQDIVNNKSIINGSFSFNDVTYNGSMYVDGQKMWFKVPFESKYIEYDPVQFLDESQSEEMKKTQEQIQQMVEKLTPLLKEFMTDYIKEYKFNFKNLKNQGKTIVKTPEGDKEVTLYELSIDFAMLEDLAKYTNGTVEQMINDGSLQELIKSIVTTIVQSNEEILEGQTIEEVYKEIDEAFVELKEEYKNNKEYVNKEIEKIFDSISKYCEVGPKGIVLVYGIDKDNNIVNNVVFMNLIFKDSGLVSPNSKTEPKVSVTLEINSTVYNINKTNVVMPKFTSNNVISIKDFVETNQFIKNLPFANYMQSNSKKRIMLQIGEVEAYTDNGIVYLDAEPYIANESTMVPVRFVGESLGAKISWRDEDRAIIYQDKDKTIEMNIGKTTAYVNGTPKELPVAPEIKNGKSMVPLRFVSEEFGADVTWNEEFRMIIIEK